MSENTNRKPNPEIRELLQITSNIVCAVDGVSSLADTLTDTLKNLSGLSGQTHGIRIAENDNELELDIHLNVCYPTKIPDLAWEIQSVVKKELEKRTGFTVGKIDIHVQGVEMKQEGES
jgi:uncharacterized alkaline shock family protein YloU